MSPVVTPYALDAYLSIIAGRADASEFIEVRRRTAGGMASDFLPVEDRELAGVLLLKHARATDVYVGCAPRTRAAGTKDAVGRVWTLWAECDGPASVEALRHYHPLPSFVIASGSGVYCHAYWPLEEPLTGHAAEVANLRLAKAIGADTACFDAGRILRPPGTWNHKHRPPSRVKTLHLDRGREFGVEDVLRNAPVVNEDRIERRWRPNPQRTVSTDPLLRIEPRVYVTDLVGRAPGRNHKVPCPFHEDRTPSLHVFRTPERGWSCFSCGRGGSVYDLAAALWGMQTRGREFVELRKALLERFDLELARSSCSHVWERR